MALSQLQCVVGDASQMVLEAQDNTIEYFLNFYLFIT
jgi:hypothetical protein